MDFYHWTSPGLLPLIQEHGLQPTEAPDWPGTSYVWLTTNPHFETHFKNWLKLEDWTTQLISARFPTYTPLRVTVHVSYNKRGMHNFRNSIWPTLSGNHNAKDFIPDAWFVFEHHISPNKISHPVVIMPPMKAAGITKDQWTERYLRRVASIEKKMLTKVFPGYEAAPWIDGFST
jgi:hypothetical protein